MLFSSIEWLSFRTYPTALNDAIASVTPNYVGEQSKEITLFAGEFNEISITIKVSIGKNHINEYECVCEMTFTFSQRKKMILFRVFLN